MHSEAVSTIIEQLQQNPRNVFVEGIQGAGKTTLLNALQQKLPAYTVYHEGDISPVDLAWCSYVTDRQYTDICQRYPQLLDQLAAYTKAEEHHKIIAYTRITTELQDFYPFMSQFEIYSGRVSFSAFRDILLRRFKRFHDNGCIFECAFFQNSIESMLLFYEMSEEEILAFYEELFEILGPKHMLLLYLDITDVEKAISQVKKERVDAEGSEFWFALLMEYLATSPYGKKRYQGDMKSLVAHLKRRQNLERRIIKEIIRDQAIILQGRC